MDHQGKEPDPRRRPRETRGAGRSEREPIDSSAPAAEGQLLALLDAIRDGVFTLDRQGRFTYVNDVIPARSGRSRSWFLGRSCLEVLREEDRQRARHYLEAALRGETVPIHEMAYPAASGELIWAEYHIAPFFQEGRVAGLVGVSRDITRRKLVETSLQQSRLRYRTLIEQIPAITYTAALDETSTTLFVSPQVEQLLGFSPSEYRKGHDIWYQQLHPEDRARVLEEVKAARRAGIPFCSQYRMLTREGRVIWVRDEARVLKDPDGTPRMLQGVMFDITADVAARQALEAAHDDLERRVQQRTRQLELINRRLLSEIQRRKEIARSLRISQARLQEAQEIARMGSYERHMQTGESYWSDELYRLLGYAPGEIASSPETFLQHVLPEDMEHVTAVMEEALRGQRPYDYKVRFVRRDGQLRHAHVIGKVDWDALGQPIRVTGTFQDITEQVAAERARDVSERKFRAIAENSAVGIAMTQHGRFVYTNRRFQEMHGYTEGELEGKDFLALVAPEDRSRVQEFVRRRLSSEPAPTRYEFKARRKDGSLCEMEVASGIALEIDGVPTIITVLQDLSEQKRTLRALEHTEKRFRLLVETMREGLASQDARGRLTYINSRLLEMTGYARDELLAAPLSLLVGREPAHRIQQQAQGVAPQQSPLEIHLRPKKGPSRACLVSPSGLFDHEGRFQGSFAIFTDISQLKRTERALRKKEEELRLKNSKLNDLNTALKVMLEARDRDRQELEEGVRKHVRDLVMPYLETLQRTRLSERQQAYLDVLQANIEEIVSPFAQKLSAAMLSLTPKEIEVANLVRLGKTSKEIAELLYTTKRTVEAHRFRIRRKMGLDDRKINLRAHLQSLD